MRRPFGKLMDLVEVDLLLAPEGTTIGDLAARYDEPMDRVMDALDAVKERRGEKSYLSVED